MSESDNDGDLLVLNGKRYLKQSRWSRDKGITIRTAARHRQLGLPWLEWAGVIYIPEDEGDDTALNPERRFPMQMSSLKTWKLFAAVMACCMLLLDSPGTMAKNLSPKQLKKNCQQNGGTYSPPGVGGAYACITGGGSVIVCDGHVPAGHQFCQGYRRVNQQTRRILND